MAKNSSKKKNSKKTRKSKCPNAKDSTFCLGQCAPGSNATFLTWITSLRGESTLSLKPSRNTSRKFGFM